VPLQFSPESAGNKLPIEQESLVSKNKPSITALNSCDANGIAIRREWKDCKWKVSLLNEVPLDFHLERTKREIENVSVNEAVDRITNALRLLSVQAEFDGENAKARCKTSDMVGFNIRLFAGNSKSQEPVIVEIQKRSGSPQSFIRICKKILDAAEGAEIQPASIAARKEVPVFMTRTPICEMKCLRNVAKDDAKTKVTTGVSKSLEMLTSKKKDVYVLGLENLCLITDPLKTRPDVALLACKEILNGQYYTKFKEEIGVIFNKDAFVPEEPRDQTHIDLFGKRHHLGLVLLSNILELTSQDGCLASAVANQKWFTDFLIPMLLDEVKGFEASSNNAYEALCGLTSLATCSDFAKKIMKENSAVDHLQIVNQFAMYHHNLLESETRRCLELMGHPI